jgi:hypothetical protein
MFVPAADVLIPVSLFACGGCECIPGVRAVTGRNPGQDALAFPLSAYFLVPPLMYHFVLVSCLLLLIVDVLRSRA